MCIIFRLHQIWVSICLYIIASGDVWVSQNCQSKPTPCVSSISNALLNYPKEYTFNIDAGVNWIVSGEFSNYSVSFVGNSINTFILFDNIQCNNCQIKFENVTIYSYVTIETFIANASSILSLENVNIMSQKYNNTNVPVNWVFTDNAKFICKNCWFYRLDSIQIQLYDHAIFNAVSSVFERIVFTNKNGRSPGFIVAVNNVTIKLQNCIINDNDEISINFIYMKKQRSNIISNHYKINITNSIFSWWDNVNGQGSILWLTPNGTITIDSTNITNNNGGVIFAEDCDLKIINCNILYNEANDDGGAIYMNKGTITLESVRFFANMVYSEKGFGGSMYVINCKVYMKDVIFSDDYVEALGGSIFGWNSIFNITSSYFNDNKADIAGGMFYIGNSTLIISDSTFMNNESPCGACVYAYDSFLLVSKSAINNNTASGLGGSLLINSSYLILLNSNASYNYGSVLQITGIDKLVDHTFISNIKNIVDIHNCLFKSNEAVSGGAIRIYVDNDIYPKMHQSSETKTCSENKYCYSVNVVATPDKVTNRVINIAAERSGQETVFEVVFTVVDNSCINPTISFDYESIGDAEHYGEIELYDNNITKIASCGAVFDECNEFVNCVNKYNLGIDKISPGEQYTISLTQSELATAKCFEYHKLSINAFLEFSCNPNVTNITNETTTYSVTNSCNDTNFYVSIQLNPDVVTEAPLLSYKINGKEIGSSNILPFTSSYVYGLKPVKGCYDVFNMDIDLLSKNDIANTIPSLFVHSHCDYYDVLMQFQQLGAHGVLLISSNENMSDSNYNDTERWIPFKCSIDLITRNIQVDYNELLSLVSTIFDTEIYLTHQMSREIGFIMEITHKHQVDSDTAEIMGNLIKAACNLNATCSQTIEQVFCSEGNVQMNKIHFRDYNKLLIPIKVVTLSDALQLKKYAILNKKFYISFKCDGQDLQLSDTNKTLDIPAGIIGYNKIGNVQITLSFPELTFNSFYRTIKYVCKLSQLDFDSNSSDLTSFSVYVDTVYQTLDKLCINANEGSQTNILSIGNNSMHIDNCKPKLAGYENITNIVDIHQGTYCFASWKMRNKNYHEYKIISLFQWTQAYIKIDKSIFVNNTASRRGGAISIESKPNTDEMLSVSITNTQFESNNGGCIFRQFSFSGIESILSSYMSILSIINVSAFIDQNSYTKEGYFLITDLATSFNDGMVFKNAISINNVNVSGMEGLYANSSAMYFQKSNVFIGASMINNVYSKNGAIFVTNTALQLYHTTVSNNIATKNGGGLYQYDTMIYENYDLCLSLIKNTFAENKAENYGGAMYANLIGINHNRESCCRLFNNTFQNNFANVANNVYFNVSGGYNSVLNNNDTLNTICSSNCSTMYSSINRFCIANDTLGAQQCQHNNFEIIKVNLSSNPSKSESIYVFARDAFGNLIQTSDYNINIESDLIMITNTKGVQNPDKPYEYIAPILVSEAHNGSALGGIVFIKDTNQIADDGVVFVTVDDCKPTEHKYWISHNVYRCLPCAVGTYTLDSTECKLCPANLKCENNGIIVQQHHHAFLHRSTDPYKGLQLETALCPTGYCCQKKTGCSYHLDNADLCSKNRNASARMCGKCLDSYSETTSSAGICRKCSHWEGKIMPIVYIFIACMAVFTIFSLSTSDRVVPSPLQIYCTRTLLFYYQTLSFISFRSYIPLLNVVTNICNLNLIVRQQGECLYVNNINPRGKILSDLFVTCILLICSASIFARYYWTDRKQAEWWIVRFTNTFDIMIRILYLQLLHICLRLCMCRQYSDGTWYMQYAGEVECFDGGHIVALMFTFFFIVILPTITYQIQLKCRYRNPQLETKLFINAILSYRQPCWYFGVIDLFRRAAIVTISMFSSSLLMLVIVFGLIIHCGFMPYRRTINNYLEMFVLSVVLLQSIFNFVDVVFVVLAFFPLIPLGWLMYESNGWLQYTKFLFAHCNPINADEYKMDYESNMNTYQFKTEEILNKWCNINDNSVTVDLNITFSHDIPTNTFIDSADLGQHISYWTQKLGSTIFINRVIGKGKYFTVEITAKWKNVQNLNKDLLEVGYELAMEEAIFNALDHNHGLRKDLIKSFKL
eukprot:40016_1